MRIIQIATLVTPDGAYGGPVRVAVNQTRALLEAGHEVQLAAGASGFGGTLPKLFDGVPVHLFHTRSLPGMGFSGTWAPGLQSWLRSVLNEADAVHIHMGRDMVTLPASQLTRRLLVPYVLQTHGMITKSSHPLAGIVDRLWTFPALQNANKILYLTPKESTDLKSLSRPLPTLEELANGVPELRFSKANKSEVIEVLFLARLHERKRPLLFVELAKKLHPIFPNVRFSMVGPDGGQATDVRESIQASGISHVLHWEGAISPDKTAARISMCDVFLLPSINEPFPMSVLEALSLGKPIVITNSCGLGPTILEKEAGIVANESLDSLVDSVKLLLEDADLRKRMSRAALALAHDDFGMRKIAERLESIYDEVSRNVKRAK